MNKTVVLSEREALILKELVNDSMDLYHQAILDFRANNDQQELTTAEKAIQGLEELAAKLS